MKFKNLISTSLLLAGLCVGTHANAQIGDMLRKLGDSVDKLAQTPNQQIIQTKNDALESALEFGKKSVYKKFSFEKLTKTNYKSNIAEVQKTFVLEKDYSEKLSKINRKYSDQALDNYMSNQEEIPNDAKLELFSLVDTLRSQQHILCLTLSYQWILAAQKASPFPAYSGMLFENASDFLDYCNNSRNTGIDNINTYYEGNLSIRDLYKRIKDTSMEQSSKIGTLNSLIKENTEDFEAKRPMRHTKLAKLRELAANDVVAQVLNYSSGAKEDGSGFSFFYPIDTSNGKCVYKVAIDENDPQGAIAQQFLSGISMMGNMTGMKELQNPLADAIDLSKGDLKNINFYKLQGAKQNKITGVTAYLRYQSRVEGLPDIFECDSNSCNIDRLKRGWALVQQKCKGAAKAF